jgi:hypothetical protein
MAPCLTLIHQIYRCLYLKKNDLYRMSVLMPMYMIFSEYYILCQVFAVILIQTSDNSELH